MNKKELVEKINSLDALTTEEKSALIDLLKQKKYGLYRYCPWMRT